MNSYVITGAGSGIGRSLLEHLADEPNARVYLVGRNEQKLRKASEPISAKLDCILVPCDISDRSQCVSHLGKALENENHLRAVFANAGVGGENNFTENDRWDEIISINLTGSYHVSQVCLPALKRSSHEYTHLTFVSSILARLGVPGYSAYCASKAGLLGLTRSLAAQYAKDRILVNALTPGWVETDMASEGIQSMAQAMGRSFEEVREQQLAMVPLNRMSTPAEIAQFMIFLTNEQQKSITGQTLDINNGALMP